MIVGISKSSHDWYLLWSWGMYLCRMYQDCGRFWACLYLHSSVFKCLVYLCVFVYFCWKGYRVIVGGGRESMRYLVEQAFSLRQCELHNLKHSPASASRQWKLFESKVGGFFHKVFTMSSDGTIGDVEQKRQLFVQASNSANFFFSKWHFCHFFLLC